VAAKRAELAGVDRKILSTQREITQLETEISTRGGMAQIENWNSRVYGLQAPGAEQFVNSSVQLVAMADPQPLPLDPAIATPRGPVQQVSLTVPTTAAPAQAAPDKAAVVPPAPIEQPVLRQATYVQPRTTGMGQGGATLQKTSYETLDADQLDAVKPASPKPVVAKASVAKVAARTPDDKPVPAKKAATVKTDKADSAKTDSGKMAKAAVAKADAGKGVAKRSPAKAATQMTALDDAWLAEATAEPTGKRSHKGRP
jgi:hypothetical protein